MKQIFFFLTCITPWTLQLHAQENSTISARPSPMMDSQSAKEVEELMEGCEGLNLNTSENFTGSTISPQTTVLPASIINASSIPHSTSSVTSSITPSDNSLSAASVANETGNIDGVPVPHVSAPTTGSRSSSSVELPASPSDSLAFPENATANHPTTSSPKSYTKEQVTLIVRALLTQAREMETRANTPQDTDSIAFYLHTATALRSAVTEAMAPNANPQILNVLMELAGVYQQVTDALASGYQVKAVVLSSIAVSYLELYAEMKKNQPSGEVISLFSQAIDIGRNVATTTYNVRTDKIDFLSNATLHLVDAAKELQKPSPNQQVVSCNKAIAALDQQSVTASDEKDTGKTKALIVLMQIHENFIEQAQTRDIDTSITNFFMQAVSLAQQACDLTDTNLGLLQRKRNVLIFASIYTNSLVELSLRRTPNQQRILLCQEIAELNQKAFMALQNKKEESERLFVLAAKKINQVITESAKNQPNQNTINELREKASKLRQQAEKKLSL